MELFIGKMALSLAGYGEITNSYSSTNEVYNDFYLLNFFLNLYSKSLRYVKKIDLKYNYR